MRLKTVAVLMATTGLLTACGPAPATPVATQTVTAWGTPTTAPSTEAQVTTSTGSASPSQNMATSESPDLASPTTPGPAIGSDDRGRPIPLERFIQVDGEWETNQFDIADRSGVQGFATKTSQCSDSYAPTIEIRLGNHFESLTFKAGTSNDGSASSDQRAVVQVVGNGTVLAVHRVPFNKIQPISVDVKNVNALKIRVSLDPEIKNCGSGGAQIVLSDVMVH